MKGATMRPHVKHVTLYMLLLFAAFVLTRFVLLGKMRSEPYRDYDGVLVTEFAVDALHARWGLDLLSVPIVAVAIAVIRRQRVGDAVVALALALVLAIGMAYFPSAVMSGQLRWARLSGDYLVLSLMYAVAISVALIVVNRIAARFTPAT